MRPKTERFPSVRGALARFRGCGADEPVETRPRRLGGLGEGTRGTLHTDIVQRVNIALARAMNLVRPVLAPAKVAVWRLAGQSRPDKPYHGILRCTLPSDLVGV